MQILSFLIWFGLWFPDTEFLNIRITNVEKIKGTFMIAAYKQGEDWLEQEPFKTAEWKASYIDEQTVQLELPPGQYAIAIYQDINDNDQLDKNIFGIPKEPYGFSNNVMGTMSPPSFEEAVIDFPIDDQPLVINLR